MNISNCVQTPTSFHSLILFVLQPVTSILYFPTAFYCCLLLLNSSPLCRSSRITTADDGHDWTQPRAAQRGWICLLFGYLSCVLLGGKWASVCISICTPPAPTAVEGGDNSKRERCRLPPSSSCSSSLPPSPLLSFSCFFQFIAMDIRIRSRSLAIILLDYAMHSPPTMTNWCWRTTVTVLSLVVGAHP